MKGWIILAKSSSKKQTTQASAGRQRSQKAQQITAHIRKSASKSLLELRQKA